MRWPPKFRSTRTTRTNVGSPTGRESYGDGGPVVVAGVTTCRGVRESRNQGEGGQVTGHHNPGGRRNAERRNGTGCPAWGRWQRSTCRHRTRVAVTGEPVAGKSGTAGSGRGPLEKDPIRGTSPAAYRYCAARRGMGIACLCDCPAATRLLSKRARARVADVKPSRISPESCCGLQFGGEGGDGAGEFVGSFGVGDVPGSVELDEPGIGQAAGEDAGDRP
jgi:hypothetical protein